MALNVESRGRSLICRTALAASKQIHRPGPRMSTISCRRLSNVARKSGPMAFFLALRRPGHKRLHMRTEQPRAISTLMHSRPLAGHDKPQEKGK